MTHTYVDTLKDNQKAEPWYPRQHVAKCLSCGGRVERYAMNLGCCQDCGLDWYMERRHRQDGYTLRAVP